MKINFSIKNAGKSQVLTKGNLNFTLPRKSQILSNAAIQKTFGYIYAAGDTLSGGSDLRGSLSLHPGILFSPLSKNYHK